MNVFEEVRLTWKGREYVIPPDKVLRTIAAIESVLPLGELAPRAPGRLQIAKIAMAFGVALRHAGADVSDEEVYQGMFEKGSDMTERAVDAVHVLYALMVPPESLRSGMEKFSGKVRAAIRRAGSSLRFSSSSSARAG